MKKWVGLILAVILLFGAAAQAETSYAKGRIAAPEIQYILAPMGGQVENFSLNAGDRVNAGETAFTLVPATVYAANDGVISAVFAKAGDSAQNIISQYGALGYIERNTTIQVNATTDGGYSDKKNRDIRVGDTLRAQTTVNSEKYNGIGTVIAVNGKNFSVELEKDDFELEDTVKFYLGTGKDYATKDYVGSGKVNRPAQIPVMGAGVVAKVLVETGEVVTRGQALFVLDSDTAVYADNEAAPEVILDQAAIVAQVLVSPGQYVAKGQAVLAVYPEGELEAVLEVDELDILSIKEGQTIRIVVDADTSVIHYAAAKEINPIGITVLDTTKYLVKAVFPNTDGLLIGMHLKGYWE
jgi:Multidrug resistance efflux pump